MRAYKTISDLREAVSTDPGNGIRYRKSNQSSSERKPDISGISFFGLTLHPKSMAGLNELVERGISENRKWISTNHNLHRTYLLHRRPRLRKFYEGAHSTFIDGMPLIALGRLYGYPLERKHRVT